MNNQKRGELKRVILIFIFAALLALFFVGASKLGITGYSIDKICLNDSECDDNNESTLDLCLDGSCSYELNITEENITQTNETQNTACSTNEDCNDNNDHTLDFCENTCIYINISWEKPKNQDIFDNGFEHELSISYDNLADSLLTLECKIYNSNSEIMWQSAKQFNSDSGFTDYVNTSSWSEGVYYENCIIQN